METVLNLQNSGRSVIHVDVDPSEVTNEIWVTSYKRKYINGKPSNEPVIGVAWETEKMVETGVYTSDWYTLAHTNKEGPYGTIQLRATKNLSGEQRNGQIRVYQPNEGHNNEYINISQDPLRFGPIGSEYHVVFSRGTGGLPLPQGDKLKVGTVNLSDYTQILEVYRVSAHTYDLIWDLRYDRLKQVKFIKGTSPTVYNILQGIGQGEWEDLTTNIPYDFYKNKFYEYNPCSFGNSYSDGLEEHKNLGYCTFSTDGQFFSIKTLE